MLIPISWLKDYVDIDITPEELGDKLVSAGFEIEDIIYQKNAIKNVVVGKILELTKHINADKLLVCKIDIGRSGELLQIVTGATNIKIGDLVPVALDGALLPDGKSIATGELRGVTSYGMLCGGSELNLTDMDYEGASVDGILILDKTAKIGEDINNVIGNDDIILDVSITSNRTDANSIYGIAREVSAITGKKLKPLPLDYKETKGDINDYIALDNKAPHLCTRYMAKVVTNIKLEKSPFIIRKRLRAVGIRPLNNIVDITNYILIEIGQPMHAFDLETIAGKKIIVREGYKQEKIVALDDKTYTLSPANLVIANEKEAMAVAGVMGGRDYSILPTTSTIVLESARFARDNVRRTTRTINLRSDSSQRFEKGVDYLSQEVGMQRSLALIDKYGYGTIVKGTLDSFPNKPENKTITFTPQEVEKILGVKVSEKDILSILNSLELETKKVGDKLVTKVPAFREDLYGVNDIAEEVIRIYGYEHIDIDTIKDEKMTKGGKTEKQLLMDKMKNILVAKGACEAVTYSFISPKAFDSLGLSEDSPLRNAIKLDNPLGEDFSIMRTTLAHSMIKVLSTNIVRGNKEGRFFEIAKTYIPRSLPLSEYPIEKNKLCIGAFGEDFYSFKGIIEDMLYVFRINASFEKDQSEVYMHPTRTAAIKVDGQKIGYLGEVDAEVAEKGYRIDKRVYIAELDAEYIIDNAKLFDTFEVISKYPAVERDLAVIASKELEAKTIIDTAYEYGGESLINAQIFDVYQGGQIEKGKKSIAINLLFQSKEKTLTDSDVNQSITNILEGFSKVGAKLR